MKLTAVGGLVDSHGGGDDVHVEVFELAGRGGTDALEPPAHDMQGILGCIQQDPARPGDGEAAQAGGAGGDRDGQIQGEEGLAAFRFPTDDADRHVRGSCLGHRLCSGRFKNGEALVARNFTA
jgi:hypothetical protein